MRNSSQSPPVSAIAYCLEISLSFVHDFMVESVYFFLFIAFCSFVCFRYFFLECFLPFPHHYPRESRKDWPPIRGLPTDPLHGLPYGLLHGLPYPTGVVRRVVRGVVRRVVRGAGQWVVRGSGISLFYFRTTPSKHLKASWYKDHP